MTTKVQELPEEGDIVIATVKGVMSHGAYVTLDEFGNMTGFLHISEIATGWIRNIERYVRPKQKVVLKVIRVNRTRAEVDLSLKQVGTEEKKAKLMEVKKDEKAVAFLQLIREKCKMPEQEFKKHVDKLSEEYPVLYDLFEEVAKKGIKMLEPMNLPAEMVAAIEEVCSKIQIPSVEVRGIMEITNSRPNGIEIIKDVLIGAEGNKGGATVNITYIGAPKYRLMVQAENFKVAEKSLNAVVQKIEEGIQKQGGTFKFVREESKKGVKS
jgi:translation initiation factor 2 subunit 1